MIFGIFLGIPSAFVGIIGQIELSIDDGRAIFVMLCVELLASWLVIIRYICGAYLKDFGEPT